jgi:mycothiol synthase
MPPEGYSVRAPTAGDAGAVAELIAACQLADGGRTGMTVEELGGDWQESEPSEEAVVVTAPDGRMAAYADALNRSYVSVSVYGYVTPEYRGRGVGSYLVCWGEEWTRERMDRAPEGTRVAVQHYVNTLNKPARRLLETSGYAALRGYYRMSIELEQALPPPECPVGIGVRTFMPEQDERDVYEAVEGAGGDVWGFPRGTFERFSGFTRQEGFDPGLGFLAESAGGIIGACLCKTAAGRGRWTWWPCGIRGGAGVWGSRCCATPSASSTAAV